MPVFNNIATHYFRRAASVGALSAALIYAGDATAQVVAPPANVDQARAADVTDPASASAAEKQVGNEGDIIVTGSRIQRAGFEAPTPTTVLGSIEIRQGNRPSIAQILDDQPQFRATQTPATTVANTNNSASTADLRGLGVVRTLTLLDGHRFTGANDLNTVPIALIKRVDVVTGGASAAWGSGAVAGVVNIILDDAFKGLLLGADAGIASRGDAGRQSLQALAGTSLLDDRLHIMVAADYTKEDGAFGRTDRPNLRSAIFQQANGQFILANNVGYTVLNTGGLILGGKANQQVFNHEGSLSPLILGSQTNGSFTVGGNSQNLYDFVAVTSPYDRENVFGRASFDVTPAAKLWVDASFSRVHSSFPFFPETPFLSIKADNAFLTPTAKAQLAGLGATYPLTVGRILTDIGSTGYMGYHNVRRNLEFSGGFDGTFKLFGHDFKFQSYYDHGELKSDQSLFNQRIITKFNNAVDAVVAANGTIQCRINTDAITTNDDPACAPLNLLGSGNASPAAVAYAFGANRQITTTKLDAAGVSFSGSPFDTWAGPVDIAAGGDFRWESLTTNYVDPLSLAKAFGSLNFTATDGKFDVKEGFGEVNVPLLDIASKLHIEANGAARYSYYSSSGGIWSWKYGGTAKVFQDILLRGSFSRDIRSPTVAEYYTNQALNLTNAVDKFTNTSLANVRNFTGGNPGLTPETSHTLTVGGSVSPRFAHGFSVGVDYYKIDIKNVIATLALQDLLNLCYSRAPGDPTCAGVITRDSNGTISSVSRTFLNLAEYKTRGLDFEASYAMPMSRLSSGIDGTVRFRVLATRVIDLLINDGVHVTNRAGVVGDTTTFDTPKWRATGSINYQSDVLGLDFRVRYVGGGAFNQPYATNGVLFGQVIQNGTVGSRTYLDVGAQVKVQQFTLFGTINNLTDRDPPFVTYASPIYDVIGRYFSAGVKLKY